MIRYSYQLNDFRHWLSGLGRLLNIPVLDGAIELPAEFGEGYVHTAHLPSGISCIIMNFTPHEDLVFSGEPSPSTGLLLSFHQAKANERGTLQLSSTQYFREIVLPRGSLVRSVSLFFPSSFLNRYLRKDIVYLLFKVTENNHASREPIPFEYRQLLDDIFTVDRLSSLHHLQLQNRLLLLAEKFLHAFLAKASFAPPEEKIWSKGKEKDLEALKDIVNILSDSQLNKFPSIETLSKTAMMSSTKLKSRFKQLYGMKLYEFYNRNRLEQAKEMLKTGNYSVKQVGVNIGFSNLSNFAKAFRKEFGLLPKEVLKNK
jgi:AraC-like DNA-binding protein